MSASKGIGPSKELAKEIIAKSPKTKKSLFTKKKKNERK